MKLTHPKAIRLNRSSEFLRVKREGRTYPGRYMVLGVLSGVEAVAGARIGIITTRRIGGAVVRNRVRRQLRELARLSRPEWGASGAWVVVIARWSAPEASFADLQAEWQRLIRKARLLAKPPGPEHP